VNKIVLFKLFQNNEDVDVYFLKYSVQLFSNRWLENNFGFKKIIDSTANAMVFFIFSLNKIFF
jgi:hypothetical protein